MTRAGAAAKGGPAAGRKAFRALKLAAAVLGAAVAAVCAFAAIKIAQFNASMGAVYNVPPPAVARSTDPAVLAHGKQLVESVGGCAGRACHGADLGGGEPLVLGPVAKLWGPGVAGSAIAAYSDGELARLIRHGIKRDGRGVLFMPVGSFGWLPDDDVAAIVSYLRSAPDVGRKVGPSEVGVLGKVLDRLGKIRLDVASRVDHAAVADVPPAGPTAAYGGFLARGCTDCHGARLSGGAIPGAPSSMAVPLNLTPDESGLKGWSFEDFDRALTEGVRKDGRRLDPFMPYGASFRYDGPQKRALWAYLQGLEPLRFGGR